MAQPEQTILTSVTKGISELLYVAVSDWRLWFVLIVTWASVNHIKHYLAHIDNKIIRNRTIESIAFVIAFLLTIWVYWGHPYMLHLAFAWGVVNPYLYKILTALLEWRYPEFMQKFKVKHKQVPP